jgi:hypothetical protein
LTEYLWQYISKYVTIIKSLQLQKTFLNQDLKVKEMKENARKCQVIIIRLNESTFKKLNTFHHLQTLFFDQQCWYISCQNVNCMLMLQSNHNQLVCSEEYTRKVYTWT